MAPGPYYVHTYRSFRVLENPVMSTPLQTYYQVSSSPTAHYIVESDDGELSDRATPVCGNELPGYSISCLYQHHLANSTSIFTRYHGLSTAGTTMTIARSLASYVVTISSRRKGVEMWREIVEGIHEYLYS